MLGDIWQFIVSLSDHWAAFMTGGLPVAVWMAWERLRNKQISYRAFVAFLVFGFIAATFQNWRQERDARVLAERTKVIQEREPNSLYQHGAKVALVKDAKLDAAAKSIAFPIVTATSEIDFNDKLEYRDLVLVCQGQFAGMMTYGAMQQINYVNFGCQIVGST